MYGKEIQWTLNSTSNKGRISRFTFYHISLYLDFVGSMPEWLSVSEDMNVFKDKLQELRVELREHITLPLDVDSYNLQMMVRQIYL